MIGRKGLFGRGVPAMPGVISGYGGGTFDMDGMPVTMPDMQNVPTTAGGRFGNPMPAQMQEPARPKSFWQGGDKFTVRDGIAGALAAIGDGLSGWAGGGVGAVGGLLQGRMEPQRLAEEQRRRAAELADYRTKKGIDAEFAQPEMDEFDTAMSRAGVVKGSPQYMAYAQEYAERKARGADPFLTNAPTPGGGSFTGSYADYQRIYGGGAAQQAPNAPETLPADFFKGGTSGNVGGSFRP